MAKGREEGFLEDTRWVDDIVTGDVPDKHETSDAVDCGDGCEEDTPSSSSDLALLTSTPSRGMTIDRDIFRGMSSRIFSTRSRWIYVKP